MPTARPHSTDATLRIRFGLNSAQDAVGNDALYARSALGRYPLRTVESERQLAALGIGQSDPYCYVFVGGVTRAHERRSFSEAWWAHRL
jgi:hypothetical protein